MAVRENAIDQELDVQGSLSVDNTRDLADEASGTGAQQATGTGDTIGGTAPAMTLTDAAGLFTADMVGSYITIAGATTGANNGTFLITGFTSATVITYENASGVAEALPGTWDVNRPYSLLDDLDFIRTDRREIKGTASHTDAVPTYQRPSAVGTNVPANLTNIAGKTTDAKTLCENRAFAAQSVASGDTDNDVTTTDRHADAVNTTGIPIQDGFDAANDAAHYVDIVDPQTQAGLTVNGGATGTITPIAASAHAVGADTDTVVIDDGTNPAVTFVYDDDGSVVETATTRAVNHTGTETAAQMRDLLIAAINSAPTLGMDASPSGADVFLQNTIPGVAGNVAIVETVADGGYAVTGMAGGTAQGGFRIFGRTRANGLTSGVAVNIEYRAVALGADISTSVAYTWEDSQPTTVDYYYKYRETLDNLDENALGRILVNGIISDSAIENALSDLRSVLGVDPGDSDFSGRLTNTGNFHIFSGADSDPTAIELFNLLNEEVGDRDYTPGAISAVPGLADGQTITASIEALANAISASSAVTRLIDRLGASIPAGGTATLPGGNSYTLDGTNNGAGLMVWWRGVLRDPGAAVNGDDYTEASTTTISPFKQIKSGDHINYLILN